MMEHPEDRNMRIASEEAAEKHVDAFVLKNIAELRSLIRTYADADAMSKLEQLREDFWSNEEFFDG